MSAIVYTDPSCRMGMLGGALNGSSTENADDDICGLVDAIYGRWCGEIVRCCFELNTDHVY